MHYWSEENTRPQWLSKRVVVHWLYHWQWHHEGLLVLALDPKRVRIESNQSTELDLMPSLFE